MYKKNYYKELDDNDIIPNNEYNCKDIQMCKITILCNVKKNKKK